MAITVVFLIAISLSMDAFSLSLAYGTFNIRKSSISILSLIVGVYHFFMPIFGMIVGQKVINLLPIKPEIIIFIILFLIGIQMIVESFGNKTEIRKLNFTEMLLFGFAVSLDSFSVGLSLKYIYKNPYVCALIFSISSSIFTFFGLNIGMKVSNYFGRMSTLLGGIILIIIGLCSLV